MFRVYSCCISYCSHFLNPTCLFLKLSQIHMFDVLKHHRCCFIHSGNQTQHFFQSSLYFDFFCSFEGYKPPCMMHFIVPSGKLPHSYRKSPFLMGKSTIHVVFPLFLLYLSQKNFPFRLGISRRTTWLLTEGSGCIRKLPPELLDVSSSEVKWCGDFNHVWWLNLLNHPFPIDFP